MSAGYGWALKVPCLRFEGDEGQAKWVYEPGNIIRYLEVKFVAGWF